MLTLLSILQNCQKFKCLAIFGNFLHNYSSDLHKIWCVGARKRGAIGPPNGVECGVVWGSGDGVGGVAHGAVGWGR